MLAVVMRVNASQYVSHHQYIRLPSFAPSPLGWQVFKTDVVAGRSLELQNFVFLWHESVFLSDALTKSQGAPPGEISYIGSKISGYPHYKKKNYHFIFSLIYPLQYFLKEEKKKNSAVFFPFSLLLSKSHQNVRN